MWLGWASIAKGGGLDRRGNVLEPIESERSRDSKLGPAWALGPDDIMYMYIYIYDR